jgi:putative salt-induced outer membrane protein YdiY
MRVSIVTMLLAVTFSTDASAKRKDDRLVLDNGDHMTGEIKKLAQGQLAFKADYMLSAIQLDWKRVRELQSQDDYQVVLANGQHVTGSIERRADGNVTIHPGGSTAAPLTIVWSDVIEMVPVETSFWRQLTGNVDSGFSYTSGDTQTQFSASGSLGYAAERYVLALSGSSTFSGQEDGTSTKRNTIDLFNQFNLKPNWYTLALVSLLNSEQQDLSLRTTLGGAVGRWLVRTTRTNLTVFGGVVYTHEQYSVPPDPSQTESQVADNIEGLLGSEFSLVNFKSTKVLSRFTVFPSLSSPGRVRLSYAPTLNLEIAHNLYWNFTLYENYDSQPPVTANKNDFGVTNSIGWKF